ncbi:phage tail protein [Ruminococcus sp.]|uniref:phage tail-collar fiber domain-containing protein n=1 Tax=Ruminococcus sp. TaxID=41978 RepID=UPI003AB832E9
MSLYKSSKITNAGQKLLINALAGNAKIQFTHIGFGAGEHESERTLVALTALKDERQTIVVTDIAAKSNNTVVCSAVLSNKELTEGYRVNEIGLYAKDSSKTNSKEILYAICIAETGYADYLPAYNGFAPVQIYQSFYIDVADSADTTIVVNDGILATKEYVDKALDTKAAVSSGNIELTIGGQGSTGAFKADCIYYKVGRQITFLIPQISSSNLPAGYFFSFAGIPDELLPCLSFATVISHNETYYDYVRYSVGTNTFVVKRSTGGNSDYYYNKEDNGGFTGGMFTYIT